MRVVREKLDQSTYWAIGFSVFFILFINASERQNRTADPRNANANKIITDQTALSCKSVQLINLEISFDKFSTINR